MQLLKDIAVAIAVVVSAFSFYEVKLKPIYVCDIQGIVKEYVSQLKKSPMDYKEKEARLEDFMIRLKRILNSYGTVYAKGSVTGRRVKDITREVKTALWNINF